MSEVNVKYLNHCGDRSKQSHFVIHCFSLFLLVPPGVAERSHFDFVKQGQATADERDGIRNRKLYAPQSVCWNETVRHSRQVRDHFNIHPIYIQYTYNIHPPLTSVSTDTPMFHTLFFTHMCGCINGCISSDTLTPCLGCFQPL